MKLFRSIRFRLTVLNVAILALVLAVVGIALRTTLQITLISAIDDHLGRIGRDMVSTMPPGPPRYGGGQGDQGGPPPQQAEQGGQDGANNAPPPPQPSDQQGAPANGQYGGGAPPGPPPQRDDFGDGQQNGNRPPPPNANSGQYPGQRDNQGQSRFRGYGPRGPRRFPRWMTRDIGGDYHARAYDRSGRQISPGVSPMLDQTAFAHALEGQESHTTVTFEKKPVRVFTIPMRRDGQVTGAIQIGHDLTDTYSEIRRLNRSLLILSPLALLLAAIGGAFLTDRALRPVGDISRAASTIGAQSLGDRLPVKGGGEFEALATTFNNMLSRLEEAFRGQEQLIDQQRRFTADASHELRTPLTVIKANTSLALASDDLTDDYADVLRSVDTAADHMSRIVQDLLLLARSDAGQLTIDPKPVAMADVLGTAIDVVSALEGPDITCDLRQGESVLGDHHILVRLFTNILTNAKRHTPPTGSITITVKRSGRNVVATIKDTGEGITAEHLPHIGERFYRVDTARARQNGGTGLGLAISRTIVTAHGGNLAIESEVGIGTTVSVTLPGA